jgi:LCP family protein required for cell wall assembly
MIAPLHAQESDDAIPEAMPRVDEGGDDIVNFLLVGSATENPHNPGLTDALMIVSANRTAGTVAVLSIPRDLYVHIPGFGMHKINTAYFYGETKNVEGGGIGLLKQTITYNLGLEINFYARVNFIGFGEIIDAVGGIDLTVDCGIQDWKLKEPDLDKQDPDNWEIYTVRAGRHHFDSEVALWYVRSRRTSSDIDRGRRQQHVIRALWRTIRARGLLNELPSLWDEITRTVDTDLGLQDVLGMLPMALNIDSSDIEYYRFRLKKEISNGISAEGQEVLKPNREAVTTLVQNFVLPTTGSRILVQRPTIAVANASGIPDLVYVVADRMEFEGFQTVVLDEWQKPRRFNKIIDYTGATKGNPVETIQKVLRVTDEGVEVQPDPNREYDFKVIVGNEYQFWSCTYDVLQPDPPTDEDTASSG